MKMKDKNKIKQSPLFTTLTLTLSLKVENKLKRK